MKLEVSTVTKLKLTELESLDPVSVILENYEPGKGKIIIECYGKSWSSYWGAMGGGTVEEFFVRVSEDYVASNLANLRDTVHCEDSVKAMCKAAILKVRRETPDLLQSHHARMLWDDEVGLEELEHGHYMVDLEGGLCRLLFDCDIYELDIPSRPNPDYEYLCRIIRAVKEGLRQYIAKNKGVA